jgi:hypothetical protein
VLLAQATPATASIAANSAAVTNKIMRFISATSF